MFDFEKVFWDGGSTIFIIFIMVVLDDLDIDFEVYYRSNSYDD
jgi:hypothetical protein